MPLPTKCFAHAALDPISIYRSRQQAFSHNHSQTRLPERVGPYHYQQAICAGAFIFFKNALEFLWFE